MQPQVYVVDTRDKFNNYRKDNSVPFDKFYLVPPEAEGSISRLTPYSIILPLTEDYKDCLAKLSLKVKPLMDSGYKVVVPINMSRVAKNDKYSSNEVHPTFMAKRRWWRNPAALGEFIPEDVTMVTPEGELTPMCAHCEYSLHHQSGECKVGTADCLEHLKLKYTPLNERQCEKTEDRELVRLKKALGEDTNE